MTMKQQILMNPSQVQVERKMIVDDYEQMIVKQKNSIAIMKKKVRVKLQKETGALKNCSLKRLKKVYYHSIYNLNPSTAHIYTTRRN